MTLLQFVVSILATWRLASLFTYERGPKNVFGRLRKRFGADDPEVIPNTELGRGLQCLWCNSIWWAAFVAGYFGLFGELSMGDWLFTTLALSAGAILLEEIRTWLEQTHTRI